MFHFAVVYQLVLILTTIRYTHISIICQICLRIACIRFSLLLLFPLLAFAQLVSDLFLSLKTFLFLFLLLGLLGFSLLLCQNLGLQPLPRDFHLLSFFLDLFAHIFHLVI